ncbi:contact-dependent growth inhibition system immunity protein [Leclercia sp. H6W5]|mgnify:CR=1 FL=1|uniref:contact-dependent growth inhibition system immunity protein n=1 Tax=Leclercia tamurae TaxID=2926467 RepID=UPI0021CF211C|nr:contact-dependent growth inhibition system immunity protein [Leclercia tamurae]MCU6681913.1 contact-dependent growth inhibition system immunity protein [Leclercia tamurae]
MRYENIAYFLGAYFHQDWFYDHPTSDEVILYFLDRESSDRCSALRQEIIGLLSNPTEISQQFISEYNGYYDPVADNLTIREWFENILAALSSRVK